MKNYSIQIMIVLLFITTNSFSAVKVVECKDEQGNRSFQQNCPPGSTQVGEKEIHTGANSKKESENANISAILYVIPDCEACIEIREFLGDRHIPITEKNVNDDIKVQKELTDLTGKLEVPTTVIGKEVITGYSRTKFMDALKAAGYIEKDSDS